MWAFLFLGLSRPVSLPVTPSPSVSVSPTPPSGSPVPPSCATFQRPLPSPHELSPILLPPDTHSSRCWPWSSRSVNWPPARPVMELGLGWAHSWVVTSVPPIPSMRTLQPLPSRWAPPSAMHQGSQGGGQAGHRMCPPWPFSSSQVRSERPLFSSNPELDNLVRPGPPTIPSSAQGSPVLPSIALGLVEGPMSSNTDKLLPVCNAV